MQTVIKDQYGRNVHSSQMKQLLGLDPKAKLPVHGMSPRYMEAVTVGDDKVEKKVMVKVWVVSLRSGRKTHRVMAECPHCHFDMSAGRLFQHRCN